VVFTGCFGANPQVYRDLCRRDFSLVFPRPNHFSCYIEEIGGDLLRKSIPPQRVCRPRKTMAGIMSRSGLCLFLTFASQLPTATRSFTFPNAHSSLLHGGAGFLANKKSHMPASSSFRDMHRATKISITMRKGNSFAPLNLESDSDKMVSSFFPKLLRLTITGVSTRMEWVHAACCGMHKKIRFSFAAPQTDSFFVVAFHKLPRHHTQTRRLCLEMIPQKKHAMILCFCRHRKTAGSIGPPSYLRIDTVRCIGGKV
jgi:hypothetical protein